LRCGPAHAVVLPALTASGLVLAVAGDTVAVIDGARRFEVECDLAALPFRPSAFAAARCVDALDRLPDPSGGVDELARTLRPGARCTFVAINRHGARRLLRRGRVKRPRRDRWPCETYPSERHLHSFTWSRFTDLVASRFAVSVTARGGSPAGRVPGLRRFSSEVVLDGIRR